MGITVYDLGVIEQIGKEGKFASQIEGNINSVIFSLQKLVDAGWLKSEKRKGYRNRTLTIYFQTKPSKMLLKAWKEAEG